MNFRDSLRHQPRYAEKPAKTSLAVANPFVYFTEGMLLVCNEIVNPHTDSGQNIPANIQ
jgi:hypothetical protein